MRFWYWVCEGDKSTHRLGFTVIKCVRSRVYAYWFVSYKRHLNQDRNLEYWVKKDVEHSDRDYKQFKCPACGNEMSKNELSDTWDWAGPHCSACGCTGMDMFSAVTLKPIVTGYQDIVGKFATLLGLRGKIR